ncbi:carbonic anhydrase family protein, partial [Elsinoe ampelina]
MGHLPAAPTNHVALVTCMDARLLPSHPPALGIEPGTTHIIRNGGGSARDALRSLMASQHCLRTEEILLIKHTDCGFSHFEKDDEVVVKVGEAGEKAREMAEGVEFEVFGSDVEGAVSRDVEFLRGCEGLKHRGKISGWVYETGTGEVRRVC